MGIALATGDVYSLGLLGTGRILDAVELALEAVPDGHQVTIRSLRALVSHVSPTNDQLEATVEALVSVGAVERVGDKLVVRAGGLSASAGYRRGVRAGLLARPAEPTSRLLVALPPSFDPTHLAIGAWDLRAAIVDLIASSEAHLLLASPFWDEETTEEFGSLLRHKVDQGVMVELVGRRVSTQFPDGRALINLVERLGSPANVHATAWFHRPTAPSDQGIQTFHFKCAIADHGARAYLGSANFTSAGLRSRAELGVLMFPPQSVELSDLVGGMLAARAR
jgi:PLD-like domain